MGTPVAAHRPAKWLVGTVAVMALGLADAQAGLDASLLTHCGMRFRIATHRAPPFIILDPTKCVEQMCPPAAFEPDGGLTYKLLMEDVLPKLKTMCADNGKSDQVEFDWFLPHSLTTSGESAINMVCNQGWEDGNQLRKITEASPTCKSSMPGGYRGASPVTSACRGAYGAAAQVCNSSGPDAAVGAIHISRERLDQLIFTTPYYFVNQVVVKRPDNFFLLSLSSIMTIFAPFTLGMWLGILAEIFVVMICILLVEVGTEHFRTLLYPRPTDVHIGQPKNDHICSGWGAIMDSWFFACGSAFDPGGPGKAPVTIGGKLFMLGHWLFVVIIAASYTGTIGPYLADTAALPVVSGIESLYDGTFSVAVRGPTFDSTVEAPLYLGVHKGGNSLTTVEPSSQWKYLQSIMRSDSTAKMQLVSTRRMDSRFKDDTTPLVHDLTTDPCRVTGAVLGAYDLVMCGRDDGADALIADAPSAFYELNRRFNATGECRLVSVGAQFSPSGFGMGFPKTSAFSVPVSYAVTEIAGRARVSELKERYGLRESDSKCSTSGDSNGGLIMTIQLLAGLFIIVGVFGFASAVHGVGEHILYLILKKKNERVGSEFGDDDDDVDGKQEDAARTGKKEVSLTERVEMLHEGSDRIEGVVKKLAKRKRAATAAAPPPASASEPGFGASLLSMASGGNQGGAPNGNPGEPTGADLVFSNLFSSVAAPFAKEGDKDKKTSKA